jgi:hypothetical protein
MPSTIHKNQSSLGDSLSPFHCNSTELNDLEVSLQGTTSQWLLVNTVAQPKGTDFMPALDTHSAT